VYDEKLDLRIGGISQNNKKDCYVYERGYMCLNFMSFMRQYKILQMYHPLLMTNIQGAGTGLELCNIKSIIFCMNILSRGSPKNQKYHSLMHITFKRLLIS